MTLQMTSRRSKTGLVKQPPDCNDFRPRHSAWKNSCESVAVMGLHENWTLVLRCQMSARPLAADAASLIEKETLEM